MTRLIKQISFILFLASLLSHNSMPQTKEINDGLKKFYDSYKVEGSFILYDLNNDHYIYYNPDKIKTPLTPASTFKILNSLIGVETGVIKDENHVIKWDGINREYSFWNRDHNLQSAFQNSVVWYYRELARQVGSERMQAFIDKVEFGNKNISGGIDNFWLGAGGLKISPEEQLNFLVRFYKEELPFSSESYGVVKKIMIADSSSNYILRAKTGWGIQNGKNVGWYIGYYEVKNNVYLFVNCLLSDEDDDNPNFISARKEIVYKIFRELKIVGE